MRRSHAPSLFLCFLSLPRQIELTYLQPESAIVTRLCLSLLNGGRAPIEQTRLIQVRGVLLANTRPETRGRITGTIYARRGIPKPGGPERALLALKSRLLLLFHLATEDVRSTDASRATIATTGC